MSRAPGTVRQCAASERGGGRAEQGQDGAARAPGQLTHDHLAIAVDNGHTRQDRTATIVAHAHHLTIDAERPDAVD